jgi:hypothetical protein
LQEFLKLVNTGDEVVAAGLAGGRADEVTEAAEELDLLADLARGSVIEGKGRAEGGERIRNNFAYAAIYSC